eukprot:scaffold70149_cov30-Tisochrysis_lutea.AAC.1
MPQLAPGPWATAWRASSRCALKKRSGRSRRSVLRSRPVRTSARIAAAESAWERAPETSSVARTNARSHSSSSSRSLGAAAVESRRQSRERVLPPSRASLAGRIAPSSRLRLIARRVGPTSRPL